MLGKRAKVTLDTSPTTSSPGLQRFPPETVLIRCYCIEPTFDASV